MVWRYVGAVHRPRSRSATVPISAPDFRASDARTTCATKSSTTRVPTSSCISTVFSARHRNGAPDNFRRSSARAKGPRIRPDAADPERLIEVIQRCPSGALRYTRHGQTGPFTRTLRASASHTTDPTRFRGSISTPRPGAKVLRASASCCAAAVHRRTSHSATARTGTSTFGMNATEAGGPTQSSTTGIALKVPFSADEACIFQRRPALQLRSLPCANALGPPALIRQVKLVP